MGNGQWGRVFNPKSKIQNPKSSRQEISILLVEDNLGDIRLLQEHLKDVTTTEFKITSVERLEQVQHQLAIADFDLILLDLFLPDSQGLKTLSQVEHLACGLPIIVLTGLDDELLALQAMEQGALDYLIKGEVDGNLLARSIRYAIYRKQVEEELRKSEERWQLAIAGSHDGIWDYNFITDEHYVSPRCLEILGYIPEELKTCQHWLSYIHPDDLPKVEKNFQQHINQETEYYSCEYRIRCKNGSYKWVLARGKARWDDTGKPIRAVGSITDITERKQAEAELRQGKEDLELRVAERTAELMEMNDRLLAALLQQNRTEQVLKEQAELLDLAHDTIITRDLDGVITFWNRGAEQMYGWSKAEAMDQICHLLFETQFSQPLAHIEAELFSQGYWQGEVVHRRRDGRWINVASRWVVQWDENHQPIKILEINNDISDRKQAEALQEQLLKQIEHERARLEAVLRQMPAAIFIAEAPSGKIILYNDQVETVLGHPPLPCETLTELSGYSAIHADGTPYAPEDYAIARSLLKGEEINSEETLYIRGDGKRAILDVYSSPIRQSNGQIIASVCAIFDITKRSTAEATLQEAERRWRSLLENVQLAVVILDLQANIEYVNPFFLNLTGYSPEELLGQNWFAYFISESHQEEIQTVYYEFLEHHRHLYYQNPILTQSGEQRFMAWNNTLLRDSDGNIIGVVSIGEDITQRHEIDRLKTEFISIVSHELRTPLTAIRGALGLLANGVYDHKPEKGKQMLNVAAQQSDRLMRLVNDILDLQRLESGKMQLVMQECSVATLVQQSVETMLSTAQAHSIEIRLNVTPLQVWADPDAVIQTLTNLLSNAIKFSPPHSTIDLSVTPLVDREKPSYALFKIQDRGRGIPPDKIEKIFERFQQVDTSDSREKGGTGLGLAICRHIIQQHSAQIWAESTLGQGSTFYFTLSLI